MLERKTTKQSQIMAFLPANMRELCRSQIDFEHAQEIRVRNGKPVVYMENGAERTLLDKGMPYRADENDLREILDYISHYSRYAYENEMRQGFLTVEGGHRIGLSGKVIVEGGRVKNMKYISSVNIRIAHEVRGCADDIFPYVTSERQMMHTLLIAPPGGGKTTVLRDMIRQISDGNQYVKGCTVGVVDERSEIAGMYLGREQNHLGIRTDVLDGCMKAEGMMMLVRSMAPRVLAVDELGMEEDIHAVEYAMHCGCKMVATVHGTSLKEVEEKPYLRKLIEEKRFERYVLLAGSSHAGRVQKIYGRDKKLLFSKQERMELCI